jgi:hypothetical protein
MPTASAVRIGCASNMERSTCQARAYRRSWSSALASWWRRAAVGRRRLMPIAHQRQQRGHSTNRCRRETRQGRRSRFNCQFSRTSRALPIFGRRDSSDENGVGSGNPSYSISPYSPAGTRRTEFICNPDRASRGSTRFDVWCIELSSPLRCRPLQGEYLAISGDGGGPGEVLPDLAQPFRVREVRRGVVAQDQMTGLNGSSHLADLQCGCV